MYELQHNSHVDNQEQISTPDRYVTVMSYPNPFNNYTRIMFNLYRSAVVTIEIYDIMGKRISIPVDNEYYEKGQHTIDWSPGDGHILTIPSGIYMVRLETNDCIRYSKMVYVK